MLSIRFRIPMALAGLLLLTASLEGAAQVKPALVRDVASATPVNGHCAGFAAGANAFVKCILYTVPPGKRLIVEQLSYLNATSPANVVSQLLFGPNNPNSANFLFGPQVVAVNPTQTIIDANVRLYSGHTLVKMHFEENQQLAAIVNYNGGSSFQQAFTFNGYLVDK